MSQAAKALGYTLVIIGIVLLIYAFTIGALHGHMGACANAKCTAREWDASAYSAIIGWFLILIGPALIFGEAPEIVKEKVREGGGEA
ncbi:MAG: hypothetical protein GSR82_06150 [Desulfurococcales archaeon]|nr:hypothetical protein [Desulfurococcales archaeon]MEB3798748.1 hypothetical protein [Desulfurococcales archaeon]MEB3845458.1 hypothetical protein [Desulfurococcales archaeon]